MPTKSKNSSKAGARKTPSKTAAGKPKAAARKSDIITVKMPMSMWSLLHDAGSAIFTKLGDPKSKLNPNVAVPLTLALAGNDEKAAAALQKRALAAQRDFANAGDWMKFAP